MLGLVCSWAGAARADVTDYTSAGTVVSTGTWTNFTTARLSGDNNSRASTTATSYDAGVIRNFAFDVPDGSIINGIEVLHQIRSNNAAATAYTRYSLSWDGGASWTATSTERSNATTTEQEYTEGSSSDTWGRTWTAAEVNDTTNFQVKVEGYTTNGSYQCQVDFVQVRVYYTPLNWPVPTFVQVNANNTTATSISLAFSSASTSGNLIVLGMLYGDTATISSVTDDHGNTYTSAVGPTAWGSHYQRMYYANNISADGTPIEVTVNLSSSAYIELYMAEYTNIDTDSPLDKTAANTGVSGGAADSGSQTITQAPELIVGYCTSGACSVGAGFTARSTFMGNVFEDKLATAVGSYSATGTASSEWVVQMLTFKAATPTAIYRSVGPNDTSDLNTAPAKTVTIAGTTATFSGAMPDNVGVGDVLQYQVDSTYYLAFISGRTSSTVYTVQDLAGGTPEAAAAGTAVNVYRAYLYLDDAVDRTAGGTENTAINAAVRNFDGFTGGTNIVANNVTWNIALYANGTTADTNAVYIDNANWTVDSAHYLRIFTPTSTSEVGASQRHAGKWNTGKYHMEVLPADAVAANIPAVINSRISNIRIEGIQIYVTDDIETYGGMGIACQGSAGAAMDCRVSNSIIHANPVRTWDDSYYIGIDAYPNSAVNGSVSRIWNNIVYNFVGTDGEGIDLDNAGAGTITHYVYNNTVVDNAVGIARWNGTAIAKNNLVKGSGDTSAYTGTFASGTDYNATDGTDDIGQGANNLTSQVFSFVDEAGHDFHLGGAFTGARNVGTTASDAYITFSTDIDGQSRPQESVWDIGADEAVSSCTAASSATGWYNASWSYRKKITFSCAMTPNSNQTDFPVLVKLATDTDLAADAQNDFDDVLFTSANGTTKLSHEIEKYDADTGELWAWVKVPTLSYTQNTALYMYYGNAGASDQRDTANVWDSAYEGVWHLHDNVLNSTSASGRDGTATGTVNVTGRVADGDDFDGGTSDNISVGTFSVVSSTLTISNWVYLDSQNASRDDRYVSKADGTGIGNHDWMTGQAGDSYFRSRWNRDTDATCLSAVYPENSRWYQITWTYNNGTVGHYVNGSSQFGSCDNAVTGGALPNNTDGVYIGNQPGSGGEVQAPDGRLDEVRISNSVRGADWIATEYNNQSAPATFTTVGSEQTSSSPPENSGNAIYMGMGY